MTREEWQCFYSTLRQRIRYRGRNGHFRSHFDAALSATVSCRRRIELLASGTEERLWTFVVNLYYPF